MISKYWFLKRWNCRNNKDLNSLLWVFFQKLIQLYMSNTDNNMSDSDDEISLADIFNFFAEVIYRTQRLKQSIKEQKEDN